LRARQKGLDGSANRGHNVASQLRKESIPICMSQQQDDRIGALEAKVEELDALVNLALRLLSLTKPVSALLERYGATETEDLAVHALLDDLAKRAEQGGMYTPSFGGFTSELFARFPATRGDREFVKLLLDTLRIDRPAYQKLHAFVAAANWPQWS
jgi:hypothetical protein